MHAVNNYFTNINFRAPNNNGLGTRFFNNSIFPPFIEAAYQGRKALVEEILHVYPDIPLREKHQAVIAADKGKHVAVVDVLLDDIDVNALDSQGYTLLMKAAEQGCTALVERIWPKTHNPLQADKKGYTALMLALVNGHHAVIETAIELDKQQNKYTCSLMIPVFDKFGWAAQLIKRFIPCPTQINPQDKAGKPLLERLMNNKRVATSDKLATLDILLKYHVFSIKKELENRFRETLSTHNAVSSCNALSLYRSQLASPAPADLSEQQSTQQVSFQQIKFMHNMAAFDAVQRTPIHPISGMTAGPIAPDHFVSPSLFCYQGYPRA